MSWILLLIQLLPSIIKIIEMIRDAIDDLPEHRARVAARKQMRVLARRQVRQISTYAMASTPAVVAADKSQMESEIEREWLEMLNGIRGEVHAARAGKPA